MAGYELKGTRYKPIIGKIQSTELFGRDNSKHEVNHYIGVISYLPNFATKHREITSFTFIQIICPFSSRKNRREERICIKLKNQLRKDSVLIISQHCHKQSYGNLRFTAYNLICGQIQADNPNLVHLAKRDSKFMEQISFVIFRGAVPAISISLLSLVIAYLVDYFRKKILPKQSQPRYYDFVYSLWFAPVAVGMLWVNSPLIENHFWFFFSSLWASIATWFLLGLWCILLTDDDLKIWYKKPLKINFLSGLWLASSLILLFQAIFGKSDSSKVFSVMLPILISVTLIVSLICHILKEREPIK